MWNLKYSNSIEAENRIVIAREVGGEEWNREMMVKGYKVSIMQDK